MRRPRWALLGLLIAAATCQPDVDAGVGPRLEPGMLSLSVLAPAAAPIPATSGVARVTGNGVDVTRSLNPGQSASVDLPPGSYTLVLAGLADGAVVSLGQRADIVVRSGVETRATVQLQSFIPDPPNAPATSVAGETITVGWQPVPGATRGYEMEWSRTAGFGSGVQRRTTTGTSLGVELTSDGVYFFRVRALTDAVPTAGHWSEASAGTGAAVADPPLITLSPDSVGFTGQAGGADPPQQTIAVTNGGGDTLDGLTAVITRYGAGQPTGWLSPSMDGATAPAGLRLSPDIDGLDAGRYSAIVEVRSSNPDVAPRLVPVTLELAPGTLPPSIRLNVTRRAFAVQAGGLNPDVQFVEVSNGGEGTLDGLTLEVVGSGAPPDGWLTATLDTTSAPALITLQPNLRGLAVGGYTSTLRVRSEGADNSPQSVTVTLTVLEAPPPPSIRLARDSVAFQSLQRRDPAAQTVGVGNGGTGTLARLSTRVASYGAGATGWLTAEISGSTAPATVTLRASSGSLAVGTYSAVVEVASPQADNNPQAITVTLTITPGSAIGLSTTSVTLDSQQGSSPAAQTVSLTNTGDGTLGGLATSVGSYTGGATGWLSATLSSATAPSTLTLAAAAGALAPGSYSATVQVTSPLATNSPRSITVALTVTPAPPDSFTVAVSASPTAGGTVSGGGSFEDSSSVTVGATANAGYTFTRWTEGGTEISTTASYTFTLTGDRTLVAVFTAISGPAIGLSASSVTFTTPEGVDPPDQTVTITNAGQGNLGGLRVSVGSYTGGATGWLDAQLSSRTAPSTLTLEPDDVDELDPGVYTAIVEVFSSQASNSPQSLNVTLTVTAGSTGPALVILDAPPGGGGSEGAPTPSR